MKTKRLSVFIDESGDLGNYNKVTEFYILSFVFHDQNNDLSGQIEKLNNSLKAFSKKEFAIHTEPLVRREEFYAEMSPKDRRNIFTKLFFFSMVSNIRFKAFVFNKKHLKNTKMLLDHIGNTLFEYFNKMNEFFDKYKEIIIYYDNGQLPIKEIVKNIFSSLFNNVVIRKVLPIDYKLFQTADMLCTLYLMNEKFKILPMSKSEKYIFNSKYDFYHDFFKPISIKEL